MNKLFASVLIGVATLTVATAATAKTSETRANYNATVDRASANYKMARDKCDSLSGNGKDVCVEEAKAVEKRAKADAKAQYEHTRKARTDARIAAADADYAVAKAKCGAKAGNDMNVCVEEAKAAQTKAVAEAKANKKVSDARVEAREDTREADYKVAAQKCDALSGADKDSCVSAAKAKFGR
jgi:hypothetical protein